ncbi:alpha/beta hydrolase [Microbacterium sp. zg.B48]|uniref:alpha/beta fold hydrolase n=1 Tax=Microbacterium sp. zg.B48 TaxID=2969408 RepID=UPI00214BBB09|nr:alpha/beta hydrolase [Microbacterium sp. zg.B48]MCR2762081.1 alpha/beta hydrolase [Microbacterium sp. zg.B48]
MSAVQSADGTSIRFDQSGSGSPLVLVLGAFNTRSAGASLAVHLAQRFTVFNYDRRGRGQSGDTAPYEIQREIEDLAALIAAAGGESAVFGYSSGAILALAAAEHGLPITGLALYEPPFPLTGRSRDFFTRSAGEIRALIAEGRPDAAVELFQIRIVGIPPEVVAQIRHAPFWPELVRVAPTLEYEVLLLASDPDLPGRVGIPTLVVAGSDSPSVLTDAAENLSRRLAHGSYRELAGHSHDIDADALGPVVTEFLAR